MRKPIKDLEDLYEIDEMGNVYSLPRLKRTPTTKFMSKEKKLKPYKNCWGYMLVDMRKDGKRFIKCVHRLVAETFIPNMNNKTQVNHIDGNKENNCVDNLEWVTCSENQYHAFEIGLKPKNFNHPFSKFTKEDILYIRNNYQKNKKGFGIRTLARKYGVCDSTIRQIVVGITYKNIK